MSSNVGGHIKAAAHSAVVGATPVVSIYPYGISFGNRIKSSLVGKLGNLLPRVVDDDEVPGTEGEWLVCC